MSNPTGPFRARLGDRGAAVRDLRHHLIGLGDLQAGPVPDGDLFDEQVERAVRAFQQRRRLSVDGIVGPQTFLALDGARWSLGDRLLQYIPGHLQHGDDVAHLQERLLTLGLSPQRVDGMFGPRTEQAVRSFQRGVGLDPDGTVGPATLRAFSALTRSVSGGSPHALHERELVRRSGHSLAGRTILLDPGHGGDDPGAVANGVVEAEVVLDLARRIERRLERHGVNVVLTRTERTSGGDESTRAAIANQWGADVVISLHCDSAEHHQARGVSTFFFGQERFGASSAVGEELAELIRRETVARTGLEDCRTHPRSWSLLQETTMPAVRLEAGYVTHPEDASRLATAPFREVIAEAVVVALQRMYLGEDDTNPTGGIRLGDISPMAEGLLG